MRLCQERVGGAGPGAAEERQAQLQVTASGDDESQSTAQRARWSGHRRWKGYIWDPKTIASPFLQIEAAQRIAAKTAT
ncbi:uncharacterized protein SPSK_09922 [Sporothrix schenckii 1099-18]|uniref:Uncharacterized protein n=1 Tax=Sporothrix schenckii 1099-18 TaxID=1397361 RepID=A0A0F2M6Q2_SPOSC|nr:uncharacterized protein SPSK_09922 [Sporothrix schenckii 1099-18]KJR85312.1 hypothetical protein SPSK_09922 [Sporothrix schenckii 1099-18]